MNEYNKGYIKGYYDAINEVLLKINQYEEQYMKAIKQRDNHTLDEFGLHV